MKLNFENYLKEYGLSKKNRRSKPISETKMINFLNKHCSIAFNSKQKIYRGLESRSDNFLFVKPKMIERKSANTNNIYNLLTSNLPSWSEYPKRSRSIICSTSFSRADGYGVTYVVYPVDGAKIGVCPGEDMWDSFRKTLGVDAEEFNGIMESMLDRCTKRFKDNDTYATLKKRFKEVDYYINVKHKGNVYKALDDGGWSDMEMRDLLRAIGYSKNKTLFDCINKALEPKRNNFKLAYAGDTLPYNKEVWISSPCLLVREDYKIDYEIK